IEATLHHAAEGRYVEELGHGVQHSARKQFEARIGAFIGIALRFTVLHDGDERVQLAALPRHLYSAPLELGDEVSLAPLVGHHYAATVAHLLRRYVLVGLRFLGYG